MSEINVRTCLDSYGKYDDTIAVTIAIDKLIRDSKKAKLVGISKDITTSAFPITPDMSFRCKNKDDSALFFEFKWSLTSSSAPTELEGEIKRYRTANFNWNDGVHPGFTDVVLVVHNEVAPIARDAVRRSLDTGDKTLSSGFAIWSWSYSRPLRSGVSKEPVLMIQEFYGGLQEQAISKEIGSGYKVPSEVLKSSRATYSFVPERPPIAYVIMFIIFHVLPSFKDPREKRTVVYMNEAVFNAAQSLGQKLLMGGEGAQLRTWLKEAFVKMKSCGLDPVTIPFNPHKAPLDYVCDKLLKPRIVKTMKRVRRTKPPPGSSLDPFLL